MQPLSIVSVHSSSTYKSCNVVDVLSINQYWSGLNILFSRICLIISSQWLHYLRCNASQTYWSVVSCMSAISLFEDCRDFPSLPFFGCFPFFRDWVKMVSGGATIFSVSFFRSRGCSSSGPCDFEILSGSSFFFIFSLEIFMVFNQFMKVFLSGVGMSWRSSWVKTLLKKARQYHGLLLVSCCAFFRYCLRPRTPVQEFPDLL